MNERVYVFLDESGNLDFSPKGTRYFVLTSVSMKRPFEINDALDSYRYRYIESGANIEYFHCYQDRKAVRDVVFGLISTHIESMQIDYIVVDKTRIPLAIQDGARFYPAMLGFLLAPVMQIETSEENNREVIVITDTIPVNRRRRNVEKAIRTTLASALPGIRFRVLHHQSRSHYGLQIADYCSWAIYRRHMTGDTAHFAQIYPAIRNAINLP